MTPLNPLHRGKFPSVSVLILPSNALNRIFLMMATLAILILSVSSMYAIAPEGSDNPYPNATFASGNDTTPPVLLNVPADDTLDCSDSIPADPVTAIDDSGPVTLIPTNSVSSFACSPGLVAWWPAEGNGNDAQDSLNASLINGTTFSSAIAGDGFSLDGVDDYLQVTDTVSYRGQSYSSAFWINTSNNVDQVIFSASDTLTGQPRILIKMTAAGQFQFTHETPQGPVGGTTITTNTPGGYNDGQWYQLVVTKADSNMSIRVNNTVQATGVDTNDFNQPLIVTLGRLSFLNFSNNENFGGTLDEIRVYSRALCDQELQALYLAGQNGTWAPTFRLTRTWNAFDAAGNFTTASQTIIFDDLTPPSLTVPAPLSIACTSPNGTPPSNQAIRQWLNSATGTDDCSCVVLTYTAPPMFQSSCEGFTTLITFTVTDECGNMTTGTSTITVYDSLPPTATCPSNIVVPTDAGSCSAVVNFSVGANDLCGSTTLNLSDSSGSSFPLGTTTVNAVVTDQCGYADSCSFTVTVEDQTAPEFSACPSNINLDICNPVANWTVPSVTDLCSAPVTLTGPNFMPGDSFPVGTTTLTYTAMDAVGNQSSCSFDVTVSDSPLLLSGSALTKGCGTNISCNGGNDGVIDVSVNGGCPPYSYNWSNGSQQEDQLDLTAGTYSLTVTDNGGQQKTMEMTLTEPTALTASAVVTDDSCGNLNGGSIDLTVTGGADCQAYNIQLTGPNGFQSSSLNNANLSAGTYDLTVSDANGCVITSTYEIQLSDETAPTAVCQDITVQIGANGIYTLTASEIDGGSFDNCGIDSIYICAETCTLVDFNTDGNGNALTAGTSLTNQLSGYGITAVTAQGGINQAWIFDSSNPTGNDPDLGTPNAQYNGPGVGNGGASNSSALGNLLIIQENNNGAPDDNAGGGTLSLSFANPVSLNYLTLVDIEENGGTVQLTTNNGPVTINIPAHGDNSVQQLPINVEGVTQVDILLQGSGALADLEYCSGDCNTEFTCADLGENEVVLTVVDASGNTATCTATVTVEEEVNLTLNCPAPITTSCTGNGGAHVSWDMPLASMSGPCTSVISNPYINGYTYLGEHNGNRYYRSHNCFNWMDANTAAQAAGGHLVVIDDASENEFIRQNISGNVAWIGLNDMANEGTFEWVNGDPVAYANWKLGEPNNDGGSCNAAGQLGEADFAVLKKYNGKWLDRRGCQNYEFIMEVPAENFISVTQVSGPTSGSFFPVGTTEIVYLATAPNGDTTSCSFTVTVEDCPVVYCHAGAYCSSYEWIDQVELGSLSNLSGNDNGYGDFTNMKETLVAGGQGSISLDPGFSGRSYREYWKVWIDWNRDGDFNDNGEMVFYGNGSSEISGTISVPANAASGDLRMRVAMRWNCYPSGPCCTYQYGEVEDYTIEVVAGNSRTAPSAPQAPVEVVEGAAQSMETGFEFSQVFPNPALKAMGQQVTLDFRAGTAGQVQLQITDLYGRVLESRTTEVTVGANRAYVSTSNLAAGTYLIQIQSGKGKASQKLVVQ